LGRFQQQGCAIKPCAKETVKPSFDLLNQRENMPGCNSVHNIWKSHFFLS